MYAVNVTRVREKMGGKKLSATALANTLDISRNTLKSYFDNPKKMPYEVISKMATVLCQDREEASEIFFAPELAQNESLSAKHSFTASKNKSRPEAAGAPSLLHKIGEQVHKFFS